MQTPPRLASVTTIVVVVSALTLYACSAPPAEAPLRMRSADLHPEKIPNRAPFGTLAGSRFHARDARWRVDRRPGRERLEVWLSEARLPRCGLPGHDSGRRVWLRIPRLTSPREGEWRTEPRRRRGLMSVHYELQEGRRWRGEEGGAAVLRIERVGELGELGGRVHVCFDDGRQSCIAGRFRATPCVSRVDGHAIRELPVGGRSDRWRPEDDE